MRLPSRAKTTSAAQINISGKWRITEMDLWDREAIDLVGPAFIEFKGEGGRFRFIAVDGWMDCRHGQRNGRPSVDFTWDGNDEGDPASGRGWVIWDVRRRILEASVRAPPGLAPGCDPRRLWARRRGLEAHRRLLHALRRRIPSGPTGAGLDRGVVGTERMELGVELRGETTYGQTLGRRGGGGGGIRPPRGGAVDVAVTVDTPRFMGRFLPGLTTALS
jgi:hypothetical protein